ncbi:hypothetical protein EEL32_07385 [Brevibacillus laterosporus]|uniref:Uncharacterized protein n=1 Tax=Brevibacillus laterosporus TaxID=1465 RepID=A0A502IRJ6_BRELA|nr:hypothetical protein [Brevibacillus laterosporus]QDX93455.1 hypothetical protein EEL30_14860 [Brevibacillus laterosporus]TPG89005.1 hypothetical protein EEL32_07385 [Brevibacillus laterosporus]
MKLRSLASRFLLLLLLFSLPSSQAHAAQEGPWTTSFTQHIQTWMKKLEEKDSQFKTWKHATIEIQTLGPGLHEWLVTMKDKGKPLGYMVVAESQESASKVTPEFVLMEYGLGEYTLFDKKLAPKDASAELYYDGFTSFWRIPLKDSHEYIDAKSGEKFPARLKPDPSVMQRLAGQKLVNKEAQLTLSRTILSTEADPFSRIDWLTARVNRPTTRTQELTYLLKQKTNEPIVITADLFEKEVMAPFTIGTVHVWDNEPYIGVWDSGLRFLPYSYIEQVGSIVHTSQPSTF